jgi:hypothetical protein
MDRILAIAVAMLRDRTLYDSARRPRDGVRKKNFS